MTLTEIIIGALIGWALIGFAVGVLVGSIIAAGDAAAERQDFDYRGSLRVIGGSRGPVAEDHIGKTKVGY